MELSEAQARVDAWIGQFEEGYWPPLANLARLTEEVGELARLLNHRFGPKTKKPGEAEYRDVDASRTLVPSDTEVIVHAGSGGGWGDPLERDPERVRWDVTEDLVSRQAARERYGVVLRDDISLDDAATRALRAGMRQQSPQRA